MVQAYSVGDQTRKLLAPWPPLSLKGKEPWTEEYTNERRKVLTISHQQAFGVFPQLEKANEQGLPQLLPEDIMEHDSNSLCNGESNIAKVNLPLDILRDVEADYSARCIIGLLFGPRPPVDHLRKWLDDTWSPLGVEIDVVQVLPKGYYLFLLKNRSMAIKVLGAGQWMFRNVPFCFFRWTKEFSASGPKPSTCPVWIELPDLPYHMYQWTDKIAGSLGKVLGHRPKTFINPSWHPQILVEIDLDKPLKESISINCGEFSIVQKVLYKHLPNACFHCGMKGHVIKDCPLKAPSKMKTQQRETTVNEKKSYVVNPPKETEWKVAQASSTHNTSDNTSNRTILTGRETQPGKAGLEGFIPITKRKSFKQKKINPANTKANFYTLLDKPELSDEDEVWSDTVPGTQLDLNRLNAELAQLEDTHIQEADDSPLEKELEQEQRQLTIIDNEQ